MALSVDWGTRVINIPKSYMSLIQASPDIYELDLNLLREDLKDLEDSIEGMPFPDTHSHNTTVTLGGVILGHVIAFINGYTVTFEDGQYAVNAVGANSNIADVMNVNQVSLRTFNSAGLQQVTTGSAVTGQDIIDIADAVWDETSAGHVAAGSTGEVLSTISTDIALDIADVPSGVWSYGSRTLTQEITASGGGLTQAEHDQLFALDTSGISTIQTQITAMQTSVEDMLGIGGENIKWTNLSFDANHNLTAARITQYTDNTLSVSRKAWQMTASYNANSELTSYQLTEV